MYTYLYMYEDVFFLFCIQLILSELYYIFACCLHLMVVWVHFGRYLFLAYLLYGVPGLCVVDIAGRNNKGGWLANHQTNNQWRKRVGYYPIGRLESSLNGVIYSHRFVLIWCKHPVPLIEPNCHWVISIMYFSIFGREVLRGRWLHGNMHACVLFHILYTYIWDICILCVVVCRARWTQTCYDILV
jgi:hypothetical protein